MKKIITIGELAQEIGVKPHVIRYWGTLGYKSLIPERLGKGGQRYYKSTQIEEFRLYKNLKNIFTETWLKKNLKDKKSILFLNSLFGGRVADND